MLLFTGLIAIMLFAFGMIALNPLMEGVDNFRASISCDDLTISDGHKVLCLGIDLAIPIIIIALLSIAGGIIISKFMV